MLLSASNKSCTKLFLAIYNVTLTLFFTIHFDVETRIAMIHHWLSLAQTYLSLSSLRQVLVCFFLVSSTALLCRQLQTLLYKVDSAVATMCCSLIVWPRPAFHYFSILSK